MSKKHISELNRARRKIASGKEQFICVALEGKKSVAATQIVCQIQADLVDSFTLDSWLLNHHGRSVLPADKTYRSRMKATRLAWIDALKIYWKDKP